MSSNSLYFWEHRCPSFDDYLEDNRLVQEVLESLLNEHKRVKRSRRSRDRLAYALEELQDRVEESLSARENERSSPDPERMSLEERLLYFLNWRNDLQILHSSMGRSLAIARRMRHGYSRDEIRSLQEIQDDITDYLNETDHLQQKAREKLEQMRNTDQPRRTGRDSGYHSPRVGTPLGNHSNGYLIDIVKDAEKIKIESMEASLRLENEVERLKAKGVDMAKDLVALNKVIESQKKELVELARMKRNNEMAEKGLGMEDEFY